MNSEVVDSMTQNYSKEELVELSNVIIRKLKINTIKRAFLMIGIIIGIIGIVGAARLLGIDPETMDIIAYAATIAVSVVLGVTVPRFMVSFFSIKVAKNALAKFQEGQFDSDYYYEQYLVSAMEVAGIKDK